MRKQRYDYPFCPHGQYVGGCGADYMCGACEMGEQPPTLTEAHRVLREIKALIASLNEVVDSTPNIAEDRRQTLKHLLTRDARHKLARAQTLIDDIRPWTHGPNDRQWLLRRHNANVAEFMAEQDAEDFDPYAGLPEYVLDGA